MRNKLRLKSHMVMVLVLAMILAGCGKKVPPSQRETEVKLEEGGGWSNDFAILMPKISDTPSRGNEYVSIDDSNACDGYLCVKYLGDAVKVKLQLFKDTSITYTYDIPPGQDVIIPLSLGSGLYSLTVYENIQSNEYAMVYAEDIDISLNDELLPFLYPNQFVNFSEESDTTALARDLTKDCTSELDAVAKVYDYMIKNITYDYAKADSVQPGYLPDVDEILRIKTGICFDYSAVMASMLRSVGIPTRMEIGYSGDAYHAWVSVYVKDVGWINDIIQFDGNIWTLMDPTFDANADGKTSLIGGGKKTEYTTMYNY